MWDVLRGFAVLGILLANMIYMAASWGSDPADFSKSTIGQDPGVLDHFAFYFVRIVADTKFITIFSILFGAGMGLAAVKAMERGAKFGRVWARRLGSLFVFGCLHGVFIWYGDILGHYAMVGFVGLLFFKCKPKTLLAWSIVCLFIGMCFNGLMLGIPPEQFVEWGREADPDYDEGAQQRQQEEIAAALASGDFARMAEARAKAYFPMLGFITFLWAPRTLGLFLLGMFLVKSGILMRPDEHRGLMKKWVAVGLSMGIAAHLAYVFDAGSSDWRIRLRWAMGMYFAAGFSFCYIPMIAAWCRSGVMTGLRARLQSVGQMAFTNYISHSVITSIIFNYCGQFDTWERFPMLLLTFAIFAFQLWLSPVWLARYRYGPLEWLWRGITYWQVPAFRK